ncbi:hypothetical protein LPW26_22440 [Rhodopseudomonas sp. HC1]|uniref:hypothetical protein n=1 Tax=Rhodopseudomonas infernalis TaxID=2897386 RepID=UPI001EE8B340|nr:hypothetical protein [Rhodopseudomonas infernalis]MCG6207416.1 hypothetical protein [Rhodopseudomonas infernalis]
MITLTVLRRTVMRKAASRTADLVRTLAVDTQVTALPDAKQIVVHDGVDEEWQKVAWILADAGIRKEGWVLSADVKTDVERRPDIDPGGFVREAIRAERLFNADQDVPPWLVSADFVVARALIETDLVNAPPKLEGSDAVGPLQVSSAEWRDLIATGNRFGEYSSDERDGGLVQIYGASWRMHLDAKSISGLMAAKDPPVGSAADPFIPSLRDVFHAYVLASPEAAVAVMVAMTSKEGKTRRMDALMSDALAEAKPPLSSDQQADVLRALLVARAKYLGSQAAPNTVAEFVMAAEADLGPALTRAFDLMKEHAPEELASVRQGEAPWFDVAEAEEAKNIVETDDAKKPLIISYFDATDIMPKPTSEKTAWCGAFAAYCMRSSGLPVPAGAALATSWKAWGDPFVIGNPDVPVGAVVVLSPAEGTNSTGHVGFFVRHFDGGAKVELLGGNQSNSLNRTAYPADRIAAIRWADLQPVGSDLGHATSPSRISQAAFDLIVAAEVSSEKVYEKRYRHPIWPGLKSGVTMAIGYDVGYATRDSLRRDWEDVISSDQLASLMPAVGIKGTAARSWVQRLGNVDISFAQAIRVHRDRVIPRWVAAVERALGPNTAQLSPDCLGALVSLAYNRGVSFSADGPRYAEMRAVKACVQAGTFAQIPGHLRAMKRLWPGVGGLLKRRDDEAAMFESGL